MTLKLIKNKRFLLLFLFVIMLFFNCQKQRHIIDFQLFAANSYQNKLYTIWSLFYSDSIAAKEQRKQLFRNNTSWSIQEEQEKLRLLSNDYLTANNFEIVDSISIQGSWINCGEKSDKTIDTLIELKINCVLGKIKHHNHISWIVKRLETNTKHIKNIKVAIHPDMYYVIRNHNNVISGVSVNVTVRQGKISRGNCMCLMNFEYKENQKTLNQELQRQLFTHTLLDTKELGYQNALEKYEGGFFTDSHKILK